jgi:hypothetical protein
MIYKKKLINLILFFYFKPMTKLLSGGFPELTPEKQIIENNMKGIIKNTFEKF